MIDFTLLYKREKSLDELARGLCPKDLHSLTNEMIDTMLELLSQAIDAHVIFIHDPQPAGLLAARRPERGRWVWRCHIDLSAPAPEVWSFLARAVSQYDAAVFSAPQFGRDLRMPQVMIAPSIDPLSDKHCELSADEIDRITQALHVPRDKPITSPIRQCTITD